ncbi:unnamed protein product [Prunus armeniaca]|uniref:Nucleolar GTP-binding protein 1 n=2 Tax=Prunus armeniaca TaxID=36596 RepID=A0A6J5W9J2_PRUAR|nr:unnamed protein product [Prunus armeniaca]
MVQYNFKKMPVVPNRKDFIDIILSRTQRQTPTVVHRGSAISSLRKFYMRKVKCTEQNFREKLSTIIDEFPRLDDVHPFYGDLLHVLYNKDHYKLALGQVNTARKLIGKISNDYVKLLKYGDSLYRCKCLKVAALGRMCTVVKRIGPSLAYLEQITRADVDVHSLTRSLGLMWMSSHTPGILDRPFEDRNIIEMCSITALAHLRAAAVLFFLDISGSCGYSIAQQAALFHSIKSLFMNKPLIIVCNKTDLQPLEGISEEDMKLVMEMKSEAMKTVIGLGGEATSDEGVLLTMSTLTEDGPRDQKERPPCIPQSVSEAKPKQAGDKEKRNTEKDLENENGGAEILDGHNVYDFVDPDIVHRLEELKREAEEGDDEFEMDDMELTPEEQKTLDRKFTSKRMGRQLSDLGLDPRMAINRARSRSVPRRGRKRERSVDRGDPGFGDAMDMDVDTPNKKLRMISRSRSRSRSRPPSEVVPGEGFKDSSQKSQALRKAKKSVKKRNKDARRGEADRVIPTLKPKHLFSGKRSIGKTQRR